MNASIEYWTSAFSAILSSIFRVMNWPGYSALLCCLSRGVASLELEQRVRNYELQISLLQSSSFLREHASTAPRAQDERRTWPSHIDTCNSFDKRCHVHLVATRKISLSYLYRIVVRHTPITNQTAVSQRQYISVWAYVRIANHYHGIVGLRVVDDIWGLVCDFKGWDVAILCVHVVRD